MKIAVKCMYILPYIPFVVLRYMNVVIFMSHTKFFYPRNTQTHTDSSPKARCSSAFWSKILFGGKLPTARCFVVTQHYKSALLLCLRYSKTSCRRLPPKINILLLLIHLVLIFQASDRNHINPIFSSISEIACSCKYHHERWFIHFFCIYFTRKS